MKIDVDNMKALLDDVTVTGVFICQKMHAPKSVMSLYRRGLKPFEGMHLRHIVSLQEWMDKRPDDWRKGLSKSTVISNRMLPTNYSGMVVDLEKVKEVYDDRTIPEKYLEAVTGISRMTFVNYRNGKRDFMARRLTTILPVQKWLDERPENWRDDLK